jgi:Asp-tRNA(Asn)/Glu-tRNA(Gln) amidotransferase A subunit family amidase
MPSTQPLPEADFDIVETTIADIHAVYKAGTLTVRQLVRMYLDRITLYDKKGPAINAIISVNLTALEEADQLDAQLKERVRRPVARDTSYAVGGMAESYPAAP